MRKATLPVNQFLRCAAANTYAASQELQELLMSSSNDRGRGDAPGAPGAPREPQPANAPAGAEAYANWLDRMQRARARQAAITRNLYTWSNYKNWADQVRDSWASDDAASANPNKPKK
jgi:hypothetical protein